jgi:hypothetical protein
MFMALRPLGVAGLGKLPPKPPVKYTTQGGQLKPNHEWVRYYEVDKNHQLKVCPKNPPFGCYMIGGYAWGQREWYPDEFAPKGFVLQPLPKPFPHPPAAPKPKSKPVSAGGGFDSPVPPPQAPPVTSSITPFEPAPTPPTVPMDTIVSEPEPTSREGVGSIVGIGLFIAIGLTLLY